MIFAMATTPPREGLVLDDEIGRPGNGAFGKNRPHVDKGLLTRSQEKGPGFLDHPVGQDEPKCFFFPRRVHEVDFRRPHAVGSDLAGIQVALFGKGTASHRRHHGAVLFESEEPVAADDGITGGAEKGKPLSFQAGVLGLYPVDDEHLPLKGIDGQFFWLGSRRAVLVVDLEGAAQGCNAACVHQEDLGAPPCSAVT